jgi:tRNA G10  N-methylase Trm11
MLNTVTTHVFVPGKNWKLSLAELVSFLEARNVNFEVGLVSREFFVVDIAENARGLAINDLGGIIKIGSVSKEFLTESLRKAFLQKNKEAKTQIRDCITSSSLIAGMLEKASGKYVFGVSVYCAEESLRRHCRAIQRFVGSSVKDELAAHGIRSEFMGFSKERDYPQLTHVEVLKKNLVENKAEILVCLDKERARLATTTAVHDPFEFQKRDVGKPNQRKIFAIPPRLARIMVNLASCTAGKTFLDPFCGVGTILQEALLAEAKVVGFDINPWCVKATVENLEWLKREYGLEQAEYAVLQGDALSLTERIDHEVDCIATEPDLGPALRHVPTTPYAFRIVEKLEPLYSGFLEQAFKALRRDGRLVFVTPFLKTRSGTPVTMRIGEKAAEIGFKKVRLFEKGVLAESIGAQRTSLMGMASFVDVEKRHKIGREIHVFQK